MDNSPMEVSEELTARIEKIALARLKELKEIEDKLSLPSTKTEDLIEIGKSIPWMNLSELAPPLVSHPNFTESTLEVIVEYLKTQWWFDDPIECRIGWETLERERAAHLKKVEELSQNS